jgi:hypothetical protein
MTYLQAIEIMSLNMTGTASDELLWTARNTLSRKMMEGF